ncbi:MAG TPA: PDZ domain-containing protein, partial [Planctomicrobium sp.]|nr:PDZ domain-containing protein [Planctomicrobium sp.]
MKRTSLAATLLACCVTFSPASQVWAVNPSNLPNNNNNNVSPLGTTPYGNSLLPGQGYYNYNNGTGSGIDPLLNSGLYYTPTYPNLNDPLSRTIPNPNPALYPNGTGRDRLNPNPAIAPNYVPPTQGNTSQLRKWRLGVYSKDLDTGVRIHEIVQGGAAHRAGLEVNDQIVSVNGFQVGYVHGQLYDCGSEFDRLADQNGWVTLLVQNSRDRSLVNVPVQLESRLSTLNGSIALANRQTLPANAVVNVELREVLNNAPQGVA